MANFSCCICRLLLLILIILYYYFALRIRVYNAGLFLFFRCCLIHTAVAKAEAEAPFILRDCAVPYFNCIVRGLRNSTAVLYFFISFFYFSLAHSFRTFAGLLCYISSVSFSVTSIASMKPYSFSKYVVQYLVSGWR